MTLPTPREAAEALWDSYCGDDKSAWLDAVEAALAARDRALLAEKYSDDRLDAVMAALLDEIELGEEWAAMTRPQRLAYLSFKAALGCSGQETDAFIRGREAGEKLAALTLLAEDEATIEAMACAAFEENPVLGGSGLESRTYTWREFKEADKFGHVNTCLREACAALTALRRLRGVES